MMRIKIILFYLLVEMMFSCNFVNVENNIRNLEYFTNGKIRSFEAFNNDTLITYYFFENGYVDRIVYEKNGVYINDPVNYFRNGQLRQRMYRNRFNKIIDVMEYKINSTREKKYVISSMYQDTIALGDTAYIYSKFANSKYNNSEFAILSKKEFNNYDPEYIFYHSDRLNELNNNMFYHVFIPYIKGWNLIYAVGFDYTNEEKTKFTAFCFKDSVFVK